MRRSILAIGLACLLGFTSVTSVTAPVSAADLVMPVKAPPPPPAPVVAEFCWPCLLIAAGIIGGVLCAALCEHGNNNIQPVSPGAPGQNT
jgi:hypothetical protein